MPRTCRHQSRAICRRMRRTSTKLCGFCSPEVACGLTPADYVSRLKKLARDNGQFDQTIEQLRAAKKIIKKPEVFEIAQGFLGRELGKKIKTREAALIERFADGFDIFDVVQPDGYRRSSTSTRSRKLSSS
jgi:predicted GTPase